LAEFPLHLSDAQTELVYRGGGGVEQGKREVADLTRALVRHEIEFTGLDIHESSLEDIFVDLVENDR